MIINFPTALYKTILPSGTESGNVTFTISDNRPPRTDLLFPKVPAGIVNKKRLPKEISAIERHDNSGQFIYQITKSGRSIEGNNSKQYETGHILEFTDQDISTLKPMYVSSTTETRQDLNFIDLGELLTAEDKTKLKDNSINIQNQLQDQLNIARKNRANSEQTVNNKQKLINDLNRNITALQVIIGINPDQDLVEILGKTIAKKEQTIIERNQAVEEANNYANEAANIVDKLRNISVVVK